MLMLAASGFVAAAAALSAVPEPPTPELNLVLKAPISTWDEAIPLGNGLLGGLLWGEGTTIRLSLDRADLWDLRTPPVFLQEDWNWATLKRLVAAADQQEQVRLFDEPYGAYAYPTKIPAGRLELELAPTQTLTQFELSLASAEGRACLADGTAIQCIYRADQPVALLRLPGPGLVAVRLLGPASVHNLGYPAATFGEAEDMNWYRQDTAQGLTYVGLIVVRRRRDATLIGVTVTSTADGPDPLAIARTRVLAALDQGFDAGFASHRRWWAEFWARSQVRVPEPAILQHYYLVQYFYGAASRPGAPPIPLQGVWTADAGGLPPWKGDYHNDLNTQTTYSGYLTSGRFEAGRCFLDFYWDLLPQFREFARRFYATPGAMVPGVMTLDGKPMGGWRQYTLTPTNAAWIGWMFAEHWRYTRDSQFLADRAYPWCAEIGTCLLALLTPDADGHLRLPLSASPEIFDNSHRAWLPPNSNYDQACVHALFVALAEMAAVLGRHDDQAKWQQAAAALGEYVVEPDTGCLQFAPGTPVHQSHRHLSHSMAIHPFGLITTDGGARDGRTIRATCERYDRLGTMAWCGYSFSWMSCLRARVGDAEAAVRNLELFVKAFVLRNGFHVNGDQTGSGFSSFTYRPFTLEGNFLATQAVHEMLLQSWPQTPGSGQPGPIRIFPATPWRWHEAEFRDLRAEGNHRVSAHRQNNATTWLRVVAGSDGVVRIRNNFGGRQPRWSRDSVRLVGDDFEVSLRTGDAVEATLPRPERVPEPPANLAQPVVINRIVLTSNQLPLRLGADSRGESRLHGDLAQVRIFNRPLTAVEVAALARADAADQPGPAGTVVALDLSNREGERIANSATPALPARVVGTVTIVDAGDGLSGKALRLDGNGFVELPHDSCLDCPAGVTLACWVRPELLPPSGARLIDKTPVGEASAYMIDTFPGDSLRLVTRDPHLMHPAKLPLRRWTHVAATVDTATGQRVLYLNGQPVAQDRR